MKYACLFGLLTMALSVGAFAHAQEAAPAMDDEAGIRKVGEEYVQAFNARDAKALSEFWSPEAVYTNRLTGEQVTGRDNIAKQFTAIFAAKPLKMEVELVSIQFVSPNVAVEQGVARLTEADGEPDAVDYSAVYVRRDGKWLLDRVTDDPKPVIRSNYEHLKSLEWMIGSWLDQDENTSIKTDCSWTKNKNFIVRKFAVSVGDNVDMSGLQIIGWDAKAKAIRSWTFDSDGGFAEGAWSKNDKNWYVRKKGTLADGSRATAVNVIKMIDADTFSLQSIERTVAGELLPNVNEVVVVRQ